MLEPLTDREHEILRLLSAGMTNQEIADKLILSPGTVKAHNHNIFSKLNVSNRTQALRRAQELGLVDNLTATAIATADHAAHQPTQPPPHNLPLNLPPFIGREKELRTLDDLLRDQRVRLITILGAGGMGKTRLALETAHQHLNMFPDGVFVVSLAQVADVRNIVPAIIDALGLPFHKTSDLSGALYQMLRTKKMLLVLDNFEHLLSGVDLVLELLEETTQLKVLVTSRERLNISAEVLFALSGLEYESPSETADPLRYDAVQFFLHWARFADPRFELRSDDWPKIARICRLTQGMPLALVLAAGWLEMLSLAEIANEISSSIDILESQMHDLPERQRSMRATIASSWARLSPAEQRIFARLSIFRGSFTREAAHQVAGAELRSLQTLLNRSFITVKEGRYEIHELLRQFGWEQLQRATHALEICAAHSEYYLNWLHDLHADLEGKNQTEALKAIVMNLDNLRLAWRWALDNAQEAWIAAALDPFYNFFLITGRAAEGVDLLQMTYQHWLPHEHTTGSPLVNRLRVRLYSLLLMVEDQQLQRADLEQCLKLAEASGDPYETAMALELLGSYASYVEHEYQQAIAFQNRALDLFQQREAWFRLASVYHKLGYDHLQITGLEALIDYTEKAYQIAKQTGNLFNQRAALGNLGSAALYLGRYREAELYYRDALGDTLENIPIANRSQMIYFCHILFLRGKFEEGRQLLQRAWEDDQSVLDVNGASFGYAISGSFAAVEGNYGDAFAYALESVRETRNDVTGTLVANLSMAMACCGLGDDVGAERHLREAFLRVQQMNFYTAATWGLPILVILRAQQGDWATAAAYAALVRHHPLSASEWLDRWTLLVETEALLREKLDEAAYAAAQQEGKGLNLETVVAQFIDSTA